MRDQVLSDCDHDRIAFLSERDGSVEVHVMDLEGSSRSPLTKNFGRQLDAQEPAEILSVAGDVLFTMDLCSRPEWSTDGQSIAYQNCGDRRDVWVMGADGSDKRNLTNSPSTDEWPCWSPDASWLAFVSDRDGCKSIYKLRTDGTELTRMTDSHEDNFPR